MIKEYMSIEELADYLGVDLQTVQAFFPPPPSFKLGKFEKYKKTDIDKWVDETNNEQVEQKLILAETLREKAKVQLREKNYDEGIKLIKESIFLFAKDPAAHFVYGYFLAKKEQWAEAEFELRKALKLNPKAEWRDEATHQITLCQKGLGTFFEAQQH